MKQIYNLSEHKYNNANITDNPDKIAPDFDLSPLLFTCRSNQIVVILLRYFYH